MKYHIEQTTLPFGQYLRYVADGIGVEFSVVYQPQCAAALGDEHVAIGQDGYRPGRFQARDDGIDSKGRWLAGILESHRRAGTSQAESGHCGYTDESGGKDFFWKREELSELH